MKKSIKLVMAMFAIMLVSVASVFAYSVDDLSNAAANGDINKVKTIVNSGVNVNERNSSGTTALYRAAVNNKTTVMKYLISKGASVDRTCDNGNRPINMAAYKGHLEVVKILVYNGCDVNAKDKNGVTPLQDAQDEGFTQIVNFLKEHGAKTSSTSSSSSSVKPDVDAFVTAAGSGDLETVKKQVSAGVDINAYNKVGWTALVNASYFGRTDVVKYLISKKANLNKQKKTSEGKDFGTPLVWAAGAGKLDCVKALVEAGADINAKYGTSGKTALMEAKDYPEIVNYLKSKGAK